MNACTPVPAASESADGNALASPSLPQLRHALAAARRHSDALFQHLQPASLYERAVSERHRFIFYIGHLEAFDRNLLADALALPAPDAALDRLFAFGIDPGCAADSPCDQPQDWPALTTVQGYVARSRRLIDQALDAAPAGPPALIQLLNVAIEHRLMHAETLCYLLHNLSPEHKRGGPPDAPCDRPAPARPLIDVPAGSAQLGQVSGFGWDNEFGPHTVSVPAFAIEQHKVTNADYLRFVADGGPEPHFWRRAPGGLRLRLMFGDIPLPPSWPVYVTHRQAQAYAAWAGRRLPSEAEFHRAAYGDDDRPYPWGHQAPDPSRGNFDFQRWDPEPVDARPAGCGPCGVHGLLGNGWEWTDTVFHPFPGFAPFPFYRGYSADFFDGDHFVLKGGSARTARPLLRRSFRNWFRPNYPYLYAGFRCVSK